MNSACELSVYTSKRLPSQRGSPSRSRSACQICMPLLVELVTNFHTMASRSRPSGPAMGLSPKNGGGAVFDTGAGVGAGQTG